MRAGLIIVAALFVIGVIMIAASFAPTPSETPQRSPRHSDVSHGSH